MNTRESMEFDVIIVGAGPAGLSAAIKLLQMNNHGNYIISLGKLCRWLAEQAESLGANIFPGFAATEVLFSNNKVCGVATGDKGVNKEGEPTSLYQAGMNLYAKQVFFAEGC